MYVVHAVLHHAIAYNTDVHVRDCVKARPNAGLELRCVLGNMGKRTACKQLNRVAKKRIGY